MCEELPPFTTVGRNHYPGMVISMDYTAEESGVPHSIGHRLRVCLVSEGTGILNLNGFRTGIISPLLVLIRENEPVLFENAIRLKLSTLYFHPGTINSDFTFENVYGPSSSFSHTGGFDHFILLPILSPDPRTRILPLDHSTAFDVEKQMKAMGRNLHEQPHNLWPCQVRSELIQFLHLVRSICDMAPAAPLPAPPEEPENGTTAGGSTLAEKVMLHLFLNYGDDLSLESLARLFNTNRTTLSAEFKQYTGMTVFEYLTGLRLEIAASILHNTYLDISEVMYKVGYRDLTHFGKIFKKRYAESPSEYRKKYVHVPY